jgi:hypothetical protein
MSAILYDGWPLAYQPNGTAALHLLSILSHHPPELPAVVALPAGEPEWLPAAAAHQVISTPNTPSGRLAWEQRTLPQLRKRLGAGLTHHLQDTAALFDRAGAVVSPTRSEDPSPTQERPAFVERLRQALALGGFSRVRTILWPADLPEPDLDFSAPVVRLPPVLLPGFSGEAGAAPLLPAAISVPDGYILYHGPERPLDLQRLLQGWSWAAGPLGGQLPLLAAGLSEAGAHELSRLAREYNLEETVVILPQISPWQFPAVYRQAAAVFHPSGTTVWGGAVRQGLASGVPVVGADTPWMDAIVGGGGILRPADDGRALGAALITVAVEDSLAQDLVRAAQKKNPGWNSPEFSNILLETYRRLTGST